MATGHVASSGNDTEDSRNELCLASELLLSMQEEVEMQAKSQESSPAKKNIAEKKSTPSKSASKKSANMASMIPMGLDYDEDALLEQMRRDQIQAEYITEEELDDSTIHGSIQIFLQFKPDTLDFHVIVKSLHDLPVVGRAGVKAGVPTIKEGDQPPNAFVKVRLLPDRSAKGKTEGDKALPEPDIQRGICLQWLLPSLAAAWQATDSGQSAAYFHQSFVVPLSAA